MDALISRFQILGDVAVSALVSNIFLHWLQIATSGHFFFEVNLLT
jgi:hypothetical protein